MTDPLELRVFVPGRPPSPNATRRRHWAADADDVAGRRGDAKLLAMEASRVAGISDFLPLRRADLVVIFNLDAERGDLDNLLAGSKPLIDGLVDAGILEDDSVRVLRSIRLAWSRALPGRAGVELIVRERIP